MSSGIYCPPDIKSRQRGFGPQVCFATVTGQAVGGADIDFPVSMPFPVRLITIASILTAQNSVFFHFKPLNKSYGGGNAITPTGRENWIPMTVQPVATTPPYYWTVLKFADYIQDFYVDMGHENGAANVITFMGVKEIGELDIYGGPWS